MKDELARRQGNAAATLLVLKQPKAVWRLFQWSADPTTRSYLVWRAGEFGSDPRLLIERLEGEKDDSVRRALILALGEYSAKELPADVRAPLVKQLLLWYRDDADPGVHAAIGWLLRHANEGPSPRTLDWGQAKQLDAIDRHMAGKKPRVRPAFQPDTQHKSPAGKPVVQGAGWYVNGQGQTLVMIQGPVEFRMGSRRWDSDRFAANDRPHMRRIERNYAIATTPVTVAQWERFLKDHPAAQYEYSKRFSPEEGGPIITVTWYEAAQYCNWLSQKEGIPEEQWCYPRKIGEGMKMPADYLRRTGYRLPTEAEIDHACKAGSQESRHFGAEIELLPCYAHFQANSKDRTWPVGQKRPNDLGLFDAHGNVWNWTQSPFLNYPRRQSAKVALDSEYDPDISEGVDVNTSRVLRGGAFDTHGPGVRSSNRGFERADFRSDYYVGLRVCRTYDLSTFSTLAPP